MARGKKDEMYLNGMTRVGKKDHGDLGYIGERREKAKEYKDEGGEVDAYLTSDICPSFVQTVKHSMKDHRPEGIFPGDMPKGRMPVQDGPNMMGDGMKDHGRRPGKAKKKEF